MVASLLDPAEGEVAPVGPDAAPEEPPDPPLSNSPSPDIAPSAVAAIPAIFMAGPPPGSIDKPNPRPLIIPPAAPEKGLFFIPKPRAGVSADSMLPRSLTIFCWFSSMTSKWSMWRSAKRSSLLDFSSSVCSCWAAKVSSISTSSRCSFLDASKVPLPPFEAKVFCDSANRKSSSCCFCPKPPCAIAERVTDPSCLPP